MRTVFLSSTGRDLQPYRDAAFNALRSLEHWHCVRMEDFTAADLPVREYCRRAASGCDVFIGLLGHCYGSTPSGDTVSYTEHEYEAAVAAARPRLIFLAPDDFAIPANILEEQSPEMRRRQKAFRAKAQLDRLPARSESFANTGELAKEILASLANWLESTARPASTVNAAVTQSSLLAKLLDRTPQATAIRERLRFLRNERKPGRLLVILPGRTNDCHQYYVERFGDYDFRFSSSDNLRSRTWAVIPWMTSLEVVLFEIGQHIFGRIFESSDDVYREFAALRKPVCFAHYINYDRWQRDNGRLVRQWVDHFVHDWPDHAPGVPLVAFLCVIFNDQPSRFWQTLKGAGDRPLRSFVEEMRRRSDLHLVVTDTLGPICRVDVKEWIGRAKEQEPSLATALDGAEQHLFPDPDLRYDFQHAYDRIVNLLDQSMGKREQGMVFAREQLAHFSGS